MVAAEYRLSRNYNKISSAIKCIATSHTHPISQISRLHPSAVPSSIANTTPNHSIRHFPTPTSSTTLPIPTFLYRSANPDHSTPTPINPAPLPLPSLTKIKTFELKSLSKTSSILQVLATTGPIAMNYRRVWSSLTWRSIRSPRRCRMAKRNSLRICQED